MIASDTDILLGQLHALLEQARGFLPSGRVDGLLRKWQPLAERREETALWAWDLALSTPSMLGTTPLDRLAKAVKSGTPDLAAAVDLLRRAPFRLGHVETGRFLDLATGESGPLLPPATADAQDGQTVLGRLVRHASGPFLTAGPLVTLDDLAVGLARRFLRGDGRGLTNPLRCAEAVMAAMARCPPSNDGRDSGADALHPIDLIARAWLKRTGEPSAEDLQAVRSHVGRPVLFHVLLRIYDITDMRLSGIYTQIARLLINTMALRSAHGSARMNLDLAAAELEDLIAAGTLPRELRPLFARLRKEAGQGTRARSDGNADLDRLMQRIRGLREKTVERGCTEAEALAAAEKVAELLDRYGLSLSEPDLTRQSCEGIGVATDRKRRAPIDDCIPAVAHVFDCRVWGETSEDDTLRYIFFGLPADVQAAVYLHDLIALAFDTETRAFQASGIYRDTHTRQRRTATTSFQAGLARGIVQKLTELRHSRDAAGNGGGRALVPVKERMIEQEMAALGLTFRRRGGARGRMVLRDAYDAGQEAGERFEYRPGIGAEARGT
ncbi:MAG: DUF2786 domain-containing protein [Acetobacteraceae bacterium]